MYLKSIELAGFKSFAKKSELEFSAPITAVVGPNGSGKSNVAEAFRFVLGEQSMKSLRSKRGEDLIWGGSHTQPRMSRASATIVFDNQQRVFDLDFDEVAITRIVHRDGINEYQINDSPVRLKDVVELLAKANIGASGHHIISQGEADRILNANPKERREMIEDSLGLKIFQFKRAEAERKLEKTEENVSQVMSLRREVAPHLKFLKKQVEKLEKAEEMRKELRERLMEYLKREELHISFEAKRLEAARREPIEALAEIEQKLDAAKKTLESISEENGRSSEILAYEAKLAELAKERDELSRDIGRIEGQIEYAKRVSERRAPATEAIPRDAVEAVAAKLEARADAAESLDVSGLRGLIKEMLASVRSLLSEAGSESADAAREIAALEREQKALRERIEELQRAEEETKQKYESLRKTIEAERTEERDAERAVYELSTAKREVEGKLRELDREKEALEQARTSFKQEMEEGAVLGGREVLRYSDFPLNDESWQREPREKQEERRKAIERIKIRIEEAGVGGGDDILKEYEEVSERDQFLEKEILDLEHSAQNLRALIEDLEQQLNARFREGISEINKEFQHFFELLFGGGTSSLVLVQGTKKKKRQDEGLTEPDEGSEEEETEDGLEIKVSLPRKKVRGLEMLSGGERALTSIALLFAMSQVNPPPFLILDETDAALDEANSRKYSGMIKELSKRTQLILITHNRETMSAAGILYGVTMGADGVSKLLSVRFEEAVKVAK